MFVYISHSQTAIIIIDIYFSVYVLVLFYKLFAYFLVDGLCGCKGAGEFIDFLYLFSFESKGFVFNALSF